MGQPLWLRYMRYSSLETLPVALALALLLAAKGNRKPLDIMQPGGSSLHVHIPDDDQGKAFIDGPVDLVARGRVWLPDAQA